MLFVKSIGPRAEYARSSTLSLRAFFSFSVLVTLSSALLVAACTGEAPDDEALEPVAEAQEEQQLFGESQTCSAAQLAGACRGPWAHRLHKTPCYNEGRSSACEGPLEPYQVNKTCLVAQQGLQHYHSESVSCNNACNLTSKCGEKAIQVFNTIAGDRSISTRSHNVTGAWSEGNFRAGDCNVTLSNAGIAQHSACGTETAYRYPLCRHWSFDNAPPGECGPADNDVASASGLSFAQLQNTTPLLSSAVTPRCSTLEDTPIDATRLATSMARRDPADAFWTTLPATEPQEASARLDLVKQAKLMFELGVTSSAVPVADLRALYASHPDEHLSCGVPARPEVSEPCQAFAVEHQLSGPLGLCQRMLSSHIAPAVFAAELDACLDLLARPELSGTSSCAGEYRTTIQALAERLLAKAFAAITKPAGTTAVQGLPSALGQIDRWYAAAALAFAQQPAQLSDATGRVLLGFWDRVYAAGAAAPVSFPTGETGSEAARTMLDTLFGQRVEAHRQVLAAAYASPAPLDEVPLLLITADSLTPLHERLRTSAPLYDLACRLKGNCAVSDANEATRILRIIGAIGDLSQLNAAIAASAGVRAEWVSAFTALRDHRTALENAYRRAAGRADASLAELYQPNVVPSAAGLEELVSGSAAMWASYQSHGILLPRDNGALRASLSQDARTQVLQDYNEAIGFLRTAREDYQRTRGDFANTILARITGNLHRDRLFAELNQLLREYENLSEDLHGLMASQDQAELLNGRFMATFVERASRPDWLPDYPIAGTPRLLSLKAGDARGSGAAVDNINLIPGIAVRNPDQPTQPLELNVGKGDMLTFNVANAWAPTCALRATTLAGPRGTSSFADPKNALTGSEGYSIAWDQGAFRAREHSSSRFSSVVDESSVCGSVKANLFQGLLESPGLPVLEMASASASASYCRKWQTGYTVTDTTSSGQRFNSSAQFAGGLRIPGTPFPTLPGGALLAVEVSGPPGDQLVADVHVVRPNGSIVFRDDAKVYLVINDKGGCSSPNTSALSVTYVHATSSAPAVEKLAEAMANVLALLATQKQIYIAQGSVTAAELSSLQTIAYDELRDRCSCELSSYPEQIRGMFDAWLASHLASIERQTRIASATRALDQLLLRLSALEHDLSGAADSSRLSALLTSWQLGHLAFHQFDDKAEDVLEYSNDFLLPMLHIRYPQALTLLRNESSDKLNELRTADWSIPFDQQATSLQEVAEAVAYRTGQASVVGGQATAAVMIAFPRPTATAPTEVAGTAKAASERSAGVWEACDNTFCLKRRPVITISPEDVYGRPSVGLGCAEAAPIIKAAAFYAANATPLLNLPWNSNPRRFDIFRMSDVSFPTEAGLLGYRVGGELEAQPGSRMRSLSGGVADAWSTFNTHSRADRDFAGTSLFGTFALELGGYATDDDYPLGNAHTLVGIFEVETRAAVGPLSGVTACRPVQP